MWGLLKTLFAGAVILTALFIFNAKERPARQGAVKTMLGTFYLKNG